MVVSIPSHAILDDVKRTSLAHGSCGFCGHGDLSDCVRLTFAPGGDVYVHAIGCYDGLIASWRESKKRSDLRQRYDDVYRMLRQTTAPEYATAAIEERRTLLARRAAWIVRGAKGTAPEFNPPECFWWQLRQAHRAILASAAARERRRKYMALDTLWAASRKGHTLGDHDASKAMTYLGIMRRDRRHGCRRDPSLLEAVQATVYGYTSVSTVLQLWRDLRAMRAKYEEDGVQIEIHSAGGGER